MFRLAVESVSRRTGRSAPAAAAYRSGELIVNNRTGRKHDFRRRRGVEEDGIFIMHPDGCEWANDRATLWNAAEAAENRKDAKVAREVIVALSWVLNRAQRRALCRRLGQFIVDRFGVAVDIALHEPSKHGDQRNWHAHLLLTTRLVGPAGLGAKTRQLDVSSTASIEIENLRATWEKFVNEALEQAGSADRVSHLSHARRGDGLLPQVTLGVAATAMERRGYPTEKGDRNREIAAFNADTLAHQEAEVRFQAQVKQVERRARAGRDSGSAGVIRTRDPASLVPKSSWNSSENAMPVTPLGPSFSDRRSTSDRRMAAARATLCIVDLLPPPRSRAIARALAELEMRDEANREALLGRVRLAFASDGPIELRYDISGSSMAPTTQVLIRLDRAGLKIPAERQGTQRIYRVPADDVVAALTQSSSADQEDFLRLLREAGVASRAEGARYARQEHDEAGRVAAEAERRQAAAQPQKAMLRPTPEKKAADLAADRQIAAYVRRKNQKRDKLVSTPRPPKAPPIVDPPSPVDRSTKSDAPKDAEAALLASAIEAGIASRNPPAASPAAPARGEIASKVETVAKPPDSRKDIVRLSAQTPAGTASAAQPVQPGSRGAAPTVRSDRQERAGKLGDFPFDAPRKAAARGTRPVLTPQPSAQVNPPPPRPLSADAGRPVARPAETALRDFGAMAVQQLAAEGQKFVQWAAEWTLAVLKGSPSRAKISAAWEHAFAPGKVRWAKELIRKWAEPNRVGVETWANAVDRLPHAELHRAWAAAKRENQKRSGRGM